MKSVLPAAAMLLAAAAAPPLAVCATPLQPYQMVRSLQLVQDRIASGDHAALPMQNKLLEMIDGRLHDASKEDFADKRNFNAMLVYAMSGGNPVTIEAVLLRLDLEKSDATLAKGVLDYLRGRQGKARSSLSRVDPMTVAPELGAFLALVKASITTTDNAAAASKLFDQARLLGPGTLVEEAALRRSLSLSASLGDAERFLRSSSQYVRRYLRSPYASQFADAFIDGIIVLHASIDPKSIQEIVTGMDADQQKLIYLRLARRSAIDGLSELSAFASQNVARSGDEDKSRSDPRAELYSNLATMTTEAVGDVLARLKSIDRGRLSENDQRLLEAAEAIAAEMTSTPDRQANETTEPASVGAEERDTANGQLPAPATSEATPRGPATIDQKSENSQTETAVVEASEPPDAAEIMVGEARKKLEAVDKLLGEAAE
jgi:chemotaxis protein MotC